MRHRDSIKQRLATLAKRFGYTVIPNWQLNTFHSAAYVKRLFEFTGIDCVIDVGANRGQYHDFLREEVGYEGLVVSFEPIPELADALRRRSAAEGNWTVKGCALGPRPSKVMFNVMKNTEFSSFLTPLADRTASFDGANAVTEMVDVDVETLDDVIKDLRGRGVARKIYLKLDTQGFDLEVLKGAGSTLNTISALQSEMCVRPIYDGMPRYGEVIEFLEQRGFVISGIFPNNAGHFPLLLEFDCFMYRPQPT